MNIQWYPGHMAKTRRVIRETLSLVDAVCEVIDARIPASSRIPDLEEFTGSRPRLVVLNRADQADPGVTRLWAEKMKSRGYAVMETDSQSGQGVKAFAPAVRTLMKDKIEADAAKGRQKTIRVMIAGIPNVGKSSFINRVTGKKMVKAEDRPGVTRGKQWIKVDRELELLDTPGMLWPKIEKEETGLSLAFTGAIRDEIIDLETLASALLERLARLYPDALRARYKIESFKDMQGFELLKLSAKNRGFLMSGGMPDTERMAKTLLDEFRGGKLGRISLEKPDEEQQSLGI